jgi:hypothetical protein
MCLVIAVNFPDRVLGQGAHAGFKWMVTHNAMGYRCGYVRIPMGHPWHGKAYDSVDTDVHGGLTFAHPDEPYNKDQPEDGWWIGFDCAHSGDAPDPELPGSERLHSMWGTVRTQDYVESQCRFLCQQAADAQAK